MITKERLEELIEQGATVYCPYFLYYDGVKLNKNTDTITDTGILIYRQIYKYESTHDFFKFDNLFETKADAEEYAEFGNITRVERLELPSWEQVQEGFYYKGSVPIYEDDRNLCFISTSKDIVLKNYASLKNQTKFKKPLTRENYNEVRRLCVKLFKGEDV